MKEKTKNIIMIFAFVYIVLGILVYLGAAITGYVIFVQTSYSLELIPENFIYNSSLILIENNQISLYPNIITDDITKTNTQNSYIISAKRENIDFTQEVIALDNSTVNIQKNKKFNIIFDSNLNNENIIRLYVKRTGEATVETFYLCNYDEECALNQSYGSVLVNNEGWYDIIIQNLNQQTDGFNLFLLKQENPQTSVLKLDYIDALKTETINYTNTIIQYSTSAEVISNEINLNGTIQAILINETLNDGAISVFYSIDQGLTWTQLTNEIINLNNSNIELRIIMTSNQNSTPEINNIDLIYLQSTEETNYTSNETYVNQTQQNSTVETPATAPSGGGGGGGGGSSNKIEKEIEVINPQPETNTEVYEIPTYQEKEPIIIGQTEVPKPETNEPFLVGLTAKIVYSGKNMIGFLYTNWGWLLLIILLLFGYVYLYLKRRKDSKKLKKRA